MKKCKHEDLIDGYLINKISEGERREFKEHYFNCASCFQKMAERSELIDVLKTNRTVFAAEERPVIESLAPAWYKKVLSALAPKQWALAGAAAAILVAVLVIAPLLRNGSPRFTLGETDTVRGSSLTLISPVIDINSVPAYFEWRKLGDDVEYQVSIYNGALIWKTTTAESRISLPDDIKAKMIAGHRYSWQVRAFSKTGTLIAVSSRVQFTISE